MDAMHIVHGNLRFCGGELVFYAAELVEEIMYTLVQKVDKSPNI